MPKDSLQRAAFSRTASVLLLCAAFWVAAAAGMAGFVAKWGFHDGRPDFGFERVLEGTAEKPYVYRQLLPALARFAGRLAPQGIKERVTADLHPHKFFARVLPPADADAGFRYVVVFYLSFAALLASLFAIRQAALDAGAGPLPAAAAAVLLVLSLPYLQTIGGFYYDSVELLCLFAAFLLAWRGRGWALALLALPATLNKEAFFFFLPTLYPVLRQRFTPRRSLALLAAALLASGAVNVATKLAFLDAPGGAAVFQLVDNLARYAHPLTYLRLENTYGLVGPKGAFVLTLALAAAVVVRGWPACPPAVKRHALLAALVNLPLFLAFSATGELRNLSFLFVALAILAALAIDRATAPS